jgi:hypothetical protein
MLLVLSDSLLLQLQCKSGEYMRQFVLLGFSILLACTTCNAREISSRTDNVLFVGNSLTYVGNLPAVFSALAGANGHAIQSYMVVSPGGTLAERVADGSAAHSLQKCGCTALILQERGGDLFGAFGNAAMAQSKQAIRTLAKVGRAEGARVVLLGTYNSPGISHQLILTESATAQAADVPYIAVTERLWHLHNKYPTLQWLRKAGGHPGKVLTLLDAILLYKQLYGRFPATKAFVVHAPIYDTHSGLTPTLRQANAPPPNTDTPMVVSYSTSVIKELLAVLEKPGR